MIPLIIINHIHLSYITYQWTDETSEVPVHSLPYCWVTYHWCIKVLKETQYIVTEFYQYYTINNFSMKYLPNSFDENLW